MKYRIKCILVLSAALIMVCNAFSIKGSDGKVLPGKRCQLQGQYCDVMNPTKQCCAGTSCGVRRTGDHVANLCVVCRDLGQPCGQDSNSRHQTCCNGLTCQRITEFASVCNPTRHKSALYVPNKTYQTFKPNHSNDY